MIPSKFRRSGRSMMPRFVYRIYEKRLLTVLQPEQLPRHVGVILDGNRRWARAFGESAMTGHRKGADKIAEFLTWCDELGIELATLFMLSTDNLARSSDELSDLLHIIEDVITKLARLGRWKIRIVGRLELLPASVAQALVEAQRQCANIVGGMTVNIAVGYGGRHEIADAVRSVLRESLQQGKTLEEIADTIDVEHIAAHLYTSGQPDPDLVIRTSGEQRLSGFLMWQSAHSEFYFCEAYWPEFRRVDFLRALRSYTLRERRLGR